jgi:hypothetical protein
MMTTRGCTCAWLCSMCIHCCCLCADICALMCHQPVCTGYGVCFACQHTAVLFYRVVCNGLCGMQASSVAFADAGVLLLL